jgi:transcriptional regulator with XRE-family HTH domain
MSLEKYFKRYRKSKNITQTKLSELSGISRATIWRFESGKHEISISSFNDMVKALGGEIVIIDKLR